MPLTSVVGREREVAAVRALLGDRRCRLVTVTGPGGVGKTRLAIEVAHDLADTLADHVRFISLASETEPGRLLPTIAQALDVREAGSVPINDRLVATLREQSYLLVVDNLEQVIGAGPRLARLLADCPTLVLLVTSRQPLRVSGEQEYPIAPLALPDPVGEATLARIAVSDAVQLFVQRAQAIRPDFTVTDDNAAAVAEICRRLDGLPLAIELAAARIRLLTPHGLLARIDHRLALLTGGAGDVPERQRTLRGAIAWSYDLLDPAEQRLFRRLAVFAGGCTVDAATTIVLDPGDDELTILDGLTSLIERSLLVQTEGADRIPRYRMLATIREFANEALDHSAEADAIRQRHADWCLEVAAWAWIRVFGPESRQVAARLEAEYDNLRSAFSWAVAVGKAEISHGLIAHLGQFWYLRGSLGEGLQWCARARASVRDVQPTLEAGVTVVEAYLLWAQGSIEQAATMLDRILVAPPLDVLPTVLANLLFTRGVVAEDQGEFEMAERLQAQAADLYRVAGEPVFVGYALSGLGLTAYHRGDVERADRLFSEALELEQAAGNAYGVGLMLSNLARLARDRGDYATAAEHYQASLRLRSEQGALSGIAGCLRGLASVAAAYQQWDRATRLYAAAAALADAIGYEVPSPARVRYDRALARLRAALGEARFQSVWSAGQALTPEQAVALALAGDAPAAANGDAATPGQETAPAGLTKRELAVLRRIVDGQTDREIAAALFIGTRTVSSHVTNILTKLGAPSRAAAAAWAVRHGVA